MQKKKLLTLIIKVKINFAPSFLIKGCRMTMTLYNLEERTYFLA